MIKNLEATITTVIQPSFYSNWCQLYMEKTHEPYEVAIVGANAKELRQSMQKENVPNALFLGGESEGTLELLKGKLNEDETYIYVCQNKTCKLPVTDVGKALSLME